MPEEDQDTGGRAAPASRSVRREELATEGMRTQIFQIDAVTTRRFTGNPVDDVLRSIAAKKTPARDGLPGRRLGAAVGHATLASAA